MIRNTKYILLFLLSITNSLTAQEFVVDSIQINALHAAPDGIGNLFVITTTNNLVKLDSSLKIAGTQNLINYGRASSIECNGSTEIAVYCYNTGVLVIFDNFLKEKNRFELSQLINPKPNLICISKTGWWCYDEYAMKISLYRSNFQKSYTLPYMVPGKPELVKISENKFTRPVILFADHSLLIPFEEVQSPEKSVTNNDIRLRFTTTPCISYNIPEVINLSNDTLTITPLDNYLSASLQKTITPQIALPFRAGTMVIKSNASLFVIKPSAIAVLRYF